MSRNLIMKRNSGYITKAKINNDICHIASYNTKDEYVLTSLTKSEAIELRNFLNEFIEANNE